MRLTTLFATGACALFIGHGAIAQVGADGTTGVVQDEAKLKRMKLQNECRTKLTELTAHRAANLEKLKAEFQAKRLETKKQFEGNPKELEFNLVQLEKKHHQKLAAVNHDFLGQRAKVLSPLAKEPLTKAEQQYAEGMKMLEKETHDAMARAKAEGNKALAEKTEAQFRKHKNKLKHRFNMTKMEIFNGLEKKLTGNITVSGEHLRAMEHGAKRAKGHAKP